MRYLHTIAFCTFAILLVIGMIFKLSWMLAGDVTLMFGFMLYRLNKFENRRVLDIKLQRHELHEAGSAITDTLKVAFDSLRRMTGERSKIQSKLTDHTSRIYRLEQSQNRATVSSHKIKPAVAQSAPVSVSKIKPAIQQKPIAQKVETNEHRNN